MNCPRCNSASPPGAAYCRVCGIQLPVGDGTGEVSGDASTSGLRPAPTYRASGSSPGPRYAPWFRRVLGSLLDGLVVGAPNLAWAIYVLFVRGTFHVGTNPGSGASMQCSYANNTFHCTGGTYLHANFALFFAGFIAINLAWGAYVVLAIAGPHGATVGMRALKIRIAPAADESASVSRLRSLGRYVIYLSFSLVNYLTRILGLLVLVNLLWPLWDARNQTLHDKFAGTVALDMRYTRL